MPSRRAAKTSGAPARGPRRRAAETRSRDGSEAALLALRDEVGALRRALAERPADGRGRSAEDPAPLQRTAERLAQALADVPKADDFQPLADHLYEFAQTTPRLLESLRALPASVGPLEDGAQALASLSEVLQATCERWTDSLLRLPRAEDYEPLAEPLREFARVAPALAESLSGVMRGLAPLGELVSELRTNVARLGALPPAASAPRKPLEAAAARMAEARGAIETALDSLPRDPEYARVAAQLREIASVSPSLTEWLKEVPPLSMPLGEAIEALERAAQALEQGERELRAALAG